MDAFEPSNEGLPKVVRDVVLDTFFGASEVGNDALELLWAEFVREVDPQLAAFFRTVWVVGPGPVRVGGFDVVSVGEVWLGVAAV